MRVTLFHRLNVTSVHRFLGHVKSAAPMQWDWETLKKVNREALQQKVSSLNNWYTRFLRLDEVKLYQDRVVALQERLLDTQEKRREIGRSLAEIRKKSNQLQDEIHKVKRSEDLDKFLNLMKDETEVLRLENETARTFQECDQAERELFTAFTNAVRDSHEKQRAQLEYTKYFGIILSITGSFLAFCYTTLRKDDLKRFIENSLVQNGGQKSNNKSDYGELVNFVKGETSKLGDMINFRQNEAQAIIEREKEEKIKQVFYYVGAGALVLVILKVISN